MKKTLLTLITLTSILTAHATSWDVGINGGLGPMIKGSAYDDNLISSYTYKNKTAHDAEITLTYHFKRWQVGVAFNAAFLRQTYSQTSHWAGLPGNTTTFTYRLGWPMYNYYAFLNHNGHGYYYGIDLGYATTADHDLAGDVIYSGKSGGVLAGVHIGSSAWFTKRVGLQLQVNARYISADRGNTCLYFPIDLGLHFRVGKGDK